MLFQDEKTNLDSSLLVGMSEQPGLAVPYMELHYITQHSPVLVRRDPHTSSTPIFVGQFTSDEKEFCRLTELSTRKCTIPHASPYEKFSACPALELASPAVAETTQESCDHTAETTRRSVLRHVTNVLLICHGENLHGQGTDEDGSQVLFMSRRIGPRFPMWRT